MNHHTAPRHPAQALPDHVDMGGNNWHGSGPAWLVLIICIIVIAAGLLVLHGLSELLRGDVLSVQDLVNLIRALRQ